MVFGIIKKPLTIVMVLILTIAIVLNCLNIGSYGNHDEQNEVVQNDSEEVMVVKEPENETVRTVNLTTGLDAPLDQPADNSDDDNKAVDEEGNLLVPYDVAHPEEFEKEELAYDDKTLLIKIKNGKNADEVLKDSGIIRTEEMFAISSGTWYEGYIKSGDDIKVVVNNVRQLDGVLEAEYNFVWENADTFKDVDIYGLTDNPQMEDQWYLNACGIQEAWEYQQENNLPLAGQGAVVAVIDTGVDYDHEELFSNMWINQGETPDNGIDDDDNGYIDDYYGVDIVNGSGSGKDDNGHGTHVAGIIAAANNGKGIVGVAFNSHIMAIKAGNASGYFLQSDIAKAIVYAHNNGADVINMSFGGTASTIAVQDALEFAYTNCVLVASAGNKGLINEGIPGLKDNIIEPTYPAALSYVLGVMSVDEKNTETSFTNFDGICGSKVEYETYAPGMKILSTIPNNKYAKWDGTSMSAPIISAMAAMLRADLSDHSQFPTKYIYGQIASTGDVKTICISEAAHGKHDMPNVANVYSALTKMPAPEIRYAGRTIFDSVSISSKNNGDGIVDSGETVALGIEMWNRWGMSKDTVITIDAYSAAGIPNPYITFSDSIDGEYGPEVSINYGNVGTYSYKDAGKIYDNDMWVGWEKPFYIKVVDNCPNDMQIALNVVITYKNGLDESDTNEYVTYPLNFEGLTVRNGYILPAIIDKDTTLTADNYYILNNSVYIPEGVTVNVEPGTQMQFWTDDPEDAYADSAIVFLKVDGELNLIGSQDEHIRLFPSDTMGYFVVQLFGNVNMKYCDVTNGWLRSTMADQGVTTVDHCTFTQNFSDYMLSRTLSGGTIKTEDYNAFFLKCDNTVTNSVFYKIGTGHENNGGAILANCDSCAFIDSQLVFSNGYNSYNNCLFYGNNDYQYDGTGGASKYNIYKNTTTVLSVDKTYRDELTGKTYALVCFNKEYNRSDFAVVNAAIEAMGGYVMDMDTEEEKAILDEQFLSSFHKYILYRYFTIDNEGNARDIHGNPIRLENSELSKKLKAGTYLTGGHGDVNPKFDALYVNDNFTNYNETIDGHNAIYIVAEFPGDIYVNDLGITEGTVNVDINSTYQIVSNPYPDNGKKLIYESKNTSVATVNENGLVTPVSTGTTEIYVYSDDRGVYSVVTVNVTNAVTLESLTASIGKDRINVGETTSVFCEFTPSNTTQRAVTFTSSDDSVVTVDSQGKVLGVAPGNAVITVSSDSNPAKRVEINVTVIEKVRTISFNDEIYTTNMEKDDEFSFYPSVSPADYTENLIWESSNPEVAYVNADGRLVKLKEGMARLKVTSEFTGISDEITVFVTDLLKDPVITKMALLLNYDGLYVVALSDDGELWHWGGKTKSPVRIETGYTVKDFLASNNLYIVSNENVLYRSSQSLTDILVDGTVDSVTFEQFLTNVEKVEGLPNFSDFPKFALKGDKSVWVWGSSNNTGLYGNGTYTGSGVPVQSSISNVADISVYGEYAALMLKDNGDLYATGGNESRINEPMLIANGVTSIQHEIHEIYRMVFSTATDIYYMNAYDITAGPWKQDSVRSDKQLDYDSERFYIENGDVYVWSYGNEYGEAGLGTEVKDTADEYVKVNGITDVLNVFYNERTTYFRTADGLYGTGQNREGQLADFSAENSYVPKKIFFGLISNYDSLTAEGNNVVDGTLEEKELIVDFNEAIVKASAYGFITLTDGNGEQISISKSLSLDKLHVEPLNGFVDGTAYTLTIPADALSTMFAVNNAEEYVITFTYHKTEQGEPVTPEPSVQPSDTKPETIINDEVERFYYTEEVLMAKADEHFKHGKNLSFSNNAVINRFSQEDPERYWLRIASEETTGYDVFSIAHNYWGTDNESLINKQIVDFNDYQSLTDLNPDPWLTEAPTNVWPFVTNAGIMNADREEVTTVGNEAVIFYVEFNRPMDTDIDLDFRFGSTYPYADYQVSGVWVTDTRWEGIAALNTTIESGQHFFSIDNAYTGDREHLRFYKDWGRFTFNIDLSSALSMTMHGEATEQGIALSWEQDDFDTLIGYNVYRSEKEDGYYQRLNDTLIPVGEEEFFDYGVYPGTTYYYNFTVVQSDLTESMPSGKTIVTAQDTMAPTLTHSPVYSAYTGSNLVISAMINDNVAVKSAQLHYRITGTSTWKTVDMVKNNDKYYGSIPTNDVTLAGLEYYISAFDGVSYSYAGTESDPYSIVVKQSIGNDQLGDVDGDGRITNRDALMIIQAVNDLLNLTQDQFVRGDINKDGELSSAEALMILKYVSGKITNITG